MTGGEELDEALLCRAEAVCSSETSDSFERHAHSIFSDDGDEIFRPVGKVKLVPVDRKDANENGHGKACQHQMLFSRLTRACCCLCRLRNGLPEPDRIVASSRAKSSRPNQEFPFF